MGCASPLGLLAAATAAAALLLSAAGFLSAAAAATESASSAFLSTFAAWPSAAAAWPACAAAAAAAAVLATAAAAAAADRAELDCDAARDAPPAAAAVLPADEPLSGGLPADAACGVVTSVGDGSGEDTASVVSSICIGAGGAVTAPPRPPPDPDIRCDTGAAVAAAAPAAAACAWLAGDGVATVKDAGLARTAAAAAAAVAVLGDIVRLCGRGAAGVKAVEGLPFGGMMSARLGAAFDTCGVGLPGVAALTLVAPAAAASDAPVRCGVAVPEAARAGGAAGSAAAGAAAAASDAAAALLACSAAGAWAGAAADTVWCGLQGSTQHTHTRTHTHTILCLHIPPSTHALAQNANLKAQETAHSLDMFHRHVRREYNSVVHSGYQ